MQPYDFKNFNSKISKQCPLKNNKYFFRAFFLLSLKTYLLLIYTMEIVHYNPILFKQ